ncbi:MAG: DUF882 domain-containing protein [Blastocatellia bacterium]
MTAALTAALTGFVGREATAEQVDGISAAEQNRRLRYGLSWTFGGKRQRGWNLYVALIARMIGTDADPGSAEFARGVAVWQRRAGLAADGRLDEETWLAMVTALQARRRLASGKRANSNLASSELQLAPAEDFFDPARPLELRYVDTTAYAAYRRLYAAAVSALGRATLANGGLRIISAYRSPSYQAVLRRQSPNSGRAGLAINSPHFTGRALDLYVGGEPVSTADWNRQLQVDGIIYRWLVSHGSEFGFNPYFYEPWHWEFGGIDSGS